CLRGLGAYDAGTCGAGRASIWGGAQWRRIPNIMAKTSSPPMGNSADVLMLNWWKYLELGLERKSKRTEVVRGTLGNMMTMQRRGVHYEIDECQFGIRETDWRPSLHGSYATLSIDRH
ncbi:MAG: hypothetical protein ACTS4T_01625, partial [Candidatus Hodgkinia cicadicola]